VKSAVWTQLIPALVETWTRQFAERPSPSLIANTSRFFGFTATDGVA
jgi:hypothetical protein